VCVCVCVFGRGKGGGRQVVAEGVVWGLEWHAECGMSGGISAREGKQAAAWVGTCVAAHVIGSHSSM